jgi:hypothetical protein
MQNKFDVDIDVGDRDAVLAHFPHTNASILKDGKLTRHNTGVYFTAIPSTAGNQATLDYKDAEARNYFKIDILNVNLYNQIKSEEHLLTLMTKEPDWNRLNTDRSFCEQLMHVGNHFDLLQQMPEPVNSIPRLAMFLAVIRPAKRHLAGKPWKEVAQTVWEKPDDDMYYFKKSHSVGYAHLVVVHMNLLCE